MRLRTLVAIGFLSLLGLASCSDDDDSLEQVWEAGDAKSISSANAASLPTDSTTDVAVRRVVYVPVYSHIYHGEGRTPLELAATLSIRNTHESKSIRLTSVRYYDSDGSLVRTFLNAPGRLGPMKTTEFVIDEKDETGGSGANFIVEWESPTPISAPVIEAVMIGTASSQGISFVTEGRVVEEVGDSAVGGINFR